MPIYRELVRDSAGGAGTSWRPAEERNTLEGDLVAIVQVKRPGPAELKGRFRETTVDCGGASSCRREAYLRPPGVARRRSLRERKIARQEGLRWQGSRF
jgi:hypothetical protein